jgi:opacity protein-like surface antigen
MIRLLFALCLITCSVSLTSEANAQSSRLYFAGYMGLNMSNDQEFNERTTGLNGEIERSNGYSFAGALGLRIDHKWRAEAEISYLTSDFDFIKLSGNGGNHDLGGSIDTYLFMLNAYYDIDFEWQKLTPFVTGGLGLVWHDAQVEPASGIGVNSTDEDFGFAWQIGTGLKYRLDENTAVTGSYRYIGTTDADIDSYEINYDNHEFRIGVEYDIPVSGQ